MSIRILLIEDNPDHILVTKKILRDTKDDYQVDFATEPKEGFKKILEGDYDLILCDYRLPGLSALEVLREMKEKGKDLPFVVVTASGNEKAAVDLMKEGAYDYVLKDISYDDILPVVIKKSIEKYKLKKENQRVENELRESEAKYSALVEQAKDGVFILQEGVFRFVNKAMAEISGYTVEEILGMPFLNIVAPESREIVAERYSLRVVGENPSSFYEFKIICKDEAIKEAELSASIIQYKGGVADMGILRDITERKKAEKALAEAYRQLKETQQQLIQSSKMAAMGQLAAGISHELNQPLTGIKGFAQAVLMDLDENSSIREDLKRIVEQSDRIDTIIRNVRYFARKSDFEMRELDVNQPIEDVLMLLSEQLRVHNICLNKSLSPNLPKIKGDRNQLQQVFLNLITNARDAIDSLKSPDGGGLTIKSTLSQDKANIEITFKDTGCGIPKENLGNIFNPFFTTKSPGGGIGLGLAIVYRIIEDHEGKVEVESQEGKGATFKIILPVIREAV